MNNSENWNWKKNPYRFDPSRGYLLCKSCWNGRHFDPPYKDKDGIRRPKTANCRQGECHCGCQPKFQELRRRVKRDVSGQAVIDTGNDVIEIK